MHFYDLEGNSQHTIIGKNGKERTTSIRDARQLGYVPSVTTIMDIQAKLWLIQYIQQQLLDVCVKFPFDLDGIFTEAEWKKDVISTMRTITGQAANRGTELHDKLEQYFLTGEVCKKDEAYIRPAIELIHNTFPDYLWVPEAGFCHEEFAFGGRVDLHSKGLPDGSGGWVRPPVIIDFKTKDKTDIKDMVPYDDHKIQLAAYQIGLGLPHHTERYNLFISTNPKTSGLCNLVRSDDFGKYWDIFYTLTKLWQLKNNYDPKEVLK